MNVMSLPQAGRRLPSGLSVLVPAAVVAAGIFFFGSTNPVTPAGYVGYLTRGAVFGHERFVGLQTGPTSSGRGWLLHVTNVSITPYTYDEDFNGADTVLSSDSLKISFRVNLVWRVRPHRVRPGTTEKRRDSGGRRLKYDGYGLQCRQSPTGMRIRYTA